jgi:hypothetical protein
MNLAQLPACLCSLLLGLFFDPEDRGDMFLPKCRVLTELFDDIIQKIAFFIGIITYS